MYVCVRLVSDSIQVELIIVQLQSMYIVVDPGPR